MCFPEKFVKFTKNTFFYRTSLVTASVKEEILKPRIKRIKFLQRKRKKPTCKLGSHLSKKNLLFASMIAL